VLAATRPQPLRGKRLPSLDGLRAISALMVVVGHAGKVLQVGRHLPFGSGVVDEVIVCDVPVAKSRFFEPWDVVDVIRLTG